MYPSSSTQSSLYTNLNVNFQVSDFTASQSHSQTQTQLPDTQNTTDPNSPEVFKQNVHMIQQQLARVQELARSALSGIENAYRPGTSPAQTSDCLLALRQALHLLSEMLRQSGVGALPMIHPSSNAQPTPTEEKLLEDVTKSIEVQYAQQKRIQDSAAVVFNLLGSVEQGVKRA